MRVKGLSLSLGFHISFFCLFVFRFVCFVVFFLSLGRFVCHFDLCSCLTACCFSYMLFIYSFIFAFTFSCNYFVCLCFFFLVFDVFSCLWSRESIFLLSTYHFQVKNNMSLRCRQVSFVVSAAAKAIEIKNKNINMVAIVVEIKFRP